MSEKRVTVRDLANKSGFSVATISRYLNGDFNAMSNETRNRLKTIIQSSGYVMKKEKSTSNTIGLVVPNLADPYFGMVVDTIECKASEHGYVLQLGVSCDSFIKEEKLVKGMLAPSITGILYMSTVTSKANCFDLLKSERKPFVVFDSYLSEVNVPAMVFSNGVYGMYEATKYLVEKGHQNIAYLSGLRSGWFEHCRYQGYVNALLSSGITVNPELVRYVDFSIDAGRQGFDELVNNNEQFTAILCENDLLAAGVYQGCQKRNIRIPEDLSVIGYNDSIAAKLLNPQLTSVNQNLNVMADAAIDLLLKQIQRQPIDNHVKNVESKLIERESVLAI